MRYCLLVIMLLLQGCSVFEEDSTNKTVVEIPCSSSAILKIEKTLKSSRNHLEGAHFDTFDTLLWYCAEGSKCILLDKQNKKTPDYGRLLYSEDNYFEIFQTDEPYKQLDERKHYITTPNPERQKRWNIYVDPSVFSINKYNEIKTALKLNLKKINAVLSEVLPAILPKNSEYAFNFHANPYLNSIVYKKYFYTDDKSSSGQILSSLQNNEVYFKCQHDTFALALRPPNQVFVVPPKSKQAKPSLKPEDQDELAALQMYESYGSWIGDIHEVDRSVNLRIPQERDQERWGLKGKDEWFSAYKSCRDGKQLSLFDYYTVNFWDFKYE